MRGLAKFIAFIAFLAGLYYARDAIIRSGVREQSLPFVKELVTAVTARWDRAELDRWADPTLSVRVSAMGNPHALDFAYYAKLGARVGDLSCNLGDYTKYKDEAHNYIAANYVCDAQFEHGAGSVLLSVLREKEDAKWRVGYFDVNSPVLNPPQAK